MRSLIITDSTGMPQPKIGLNLADTYTGKIGGDLERLSGGGYPIKEFYGRVYNFSSYVEDKSFDIGVIGLGLADCAPRPIPAEVRSVVERLPLPLRYLAIKVLHTLRPQLVRIKLNQYTPIDEFTYYYNEILKITNRLCKFIIVVEISPIRKELEKHSPGFKNQIATYNVHIAEMARYYTTANIVRFDYDINDSHLTDDAHLTVEGHLYVWRKLHQILLLYKILQHNNIPLDD
jgi:hypothetical protein